MDSKQISVIKVGGSILSLSNDILFDFPKAKELKELLIPLSDKHKFVLITGGGYICRVYQKLLKDEGYSDYDQHYVGTCTCNLNAIMLRTVFGEEAEESVLTFNDFDSPEEIKFEKNFLLGGAAKPGPSSDWDAAFIAKRVGAKKVLSLKDIDGVYTADPKKDPSAKRLDKISWEEYMQIIGNPDAHKPGGNLPVDPLAAKFCMENGIGFFIISGNDFENIGKLLKGENYVGTVIE